MGTSLVRGFSRREVTTIGNVWVDLTRAMLYVLLPVSGIATLFFVWQGVPQTLGAGGDAAEQEGSYTYRMSAWLAGGGARNQILITVGASAGRY